MEMRVTCVLKTVTEPINTCVCDGTSLAITDVSLDDQTWNYECARAKDNLL